MWITSIVCLTLFFIIGITDWFNVDAIDCCKYCVIDVVNAKNIPAANTICLSNSVNEILTNGLKRTIKNRLTYSFSKTFKVVKPQKINKK